MKIAMKTKTHQYECRTYSGEVRASGDNNRTVVGYAAKYNTYSEDLGGFVEIIEPGAFDDVLENDVRALFNHDNNHILARTTSGTLTLATDENGLIYRFEAPNTTFGNDLLVSLERGDISQSSFGFSLLPDGSYWEEEEGGRVVRHITKVNRLYDVSPVVFPAYQDTEVTVRSLNEWKKQQAAPDLKEVTKNIESRKRKLYLFLEE